MIINSSFIGSIMSKEDIDKQIEAIKKSTKNACKTKESALKFLVDAGIIKKINDGTK